MPTIPDQSDWNFDLLVKADELISEAGKYFKLDPYPNQIEVITSEQMLDAYSTVGLPVFYNHWSFGKNFIRDKKNYEQGNMGLAYEIIINSNPSISYLMETNTLMLQILTLSHAAQGHSSFFKNNYLFKEWTDAGSIIDYLSFAKNYIKDCELRYGEDAVENILDSAHALQVLGVDRYRRSAKLSFEKEQKRQKERAEYAQSQVNELWKTIPSGPGQPEKSQHSLKDPEENLLYFIEKNAPLLEPWQREIIRIVRKVAQYFYPQRQTQVGNEGHATFWHYNIMNKLYEDDHIGDGVMLEFIQSHTSVVRQQPMSSINPYALGFAMYRDIRRMCETPTDEDRYWFPELAGKNWVDETQNAAYNFRDESFILQYLSPRVMRELRLFSVLDESSESYLKISGIHDDEGYLDIRNKLSDGYNLSLSDPHIQVIGFNKSGDRSLTLRHVPHNNRSLNDHWPDVLAHIQNLWGFDVNLETICAGNLVEYNITEV